MNINFIAGKHDSLALNEQLAKKLNKLEKFFRAECEATVRYAVENNKHEMSINLKSGKAEFTAKAESYDSYANIDVCVDKIKAQIKSHKFDNSEKTGLKGSYKAELEEMENDPELAE